MREWMADYLLDHPCVDCGEADIRVLDFDHVDPTTKFGNVTTMVFSLFSQQRIQAELAKCVIRCANCHRRKEASTRLFWRHTWMLENGRLPESDG